MNIAVFGIGYVGVVSAACLAVRGHRVWGVDVNPDKVERLNAGFSPIVEPGVEEELTLGVGIGTTAREPGSSFSFALVTDTHIGSDLAYTNQGDEVTLSGVSREIAMSSPDLVVNLGDILDFHEYGFNTPPPTGSITREAYLNYRAAFGSTLSYAAHFGVLGG